MEEQEGIPHYEQIINMLHEGEISKAAFNQLLLQNQGLRHWWENYKMLERALKDEDFMKLLRQEKSN